MADSLSIDRLSAAGPYAAVRLRRLRTFDVAFAFAALAAFAILLILGRGMTFFHDEWSYIDGRGAWTMDALMRPHNEHWSLVPVLIFKMLLEVFGLRTYLPYQAALLVLHVVAAAGLYRLIRGEAGGFLALAGSCLFLFLGTAAQALLWPALLGWSAAAAAGLWALALAVDGDRPTRPWLVAVLLVAAVASSGAGLFFLVVVAVALLTTAGRRSSLWALVPALVAYGAWYVMYGHRTVAAGTLSPDNLTAIPEFVVRGFGNAMGRLTGWGDEPGVILAVVITLATVWHLLSEGLLRRGALLGLVGVLAHFGIIGLARARFGPEQAQQQWYLYVAAPFLLLAICSWLGSLRIDIRRARSFLTLGVLFAIAVGANLTALGYTRSVLLTKADETRATIAVLMRFAGSPAVPRTIGLFPIPGPDRLAALFARFGSPMEDALEGIGPPSDAAMDRVLFQVVLPSMMSGPADALPAAPMPISADVAVDLVAAPVDGCLEMRPTGPAPHVEFSAPGGATIFADGDGQARVYLSQFGTFQEAASVVVPMVAGTPATVAVPDIGAEADWRVRIDPPALGTTRLCMEPPPRTARGVITPFSRFPGLRRRHPLAEG